MDLRRVYYQFIEDRRVKQSSLERFERHHIVPVCLGGGNEAENMVRLVPEEHLFAHILLAKIHGGVLTTTVIRMLGMKRYQGRRSRLLYRQIRDQHRVLVSKIMTGRVVSTESRRKMSESQRDPEVQKRIHTPESRLKKSVAAKGKKKSEETKARMREIWKDPEVRAARGVAWGRPHPPEVRAKISAANRGRKPTEEELLKMRQPRSPEFRETMRRVALARVAKKRSAGQEDRPRGEKDAE